MYLLTNDLNLKTSHIKFVSSVIGLFFKALFLYPNPRIYLNVIGDLTEN
jgi:hypothetical protein